MVDVPTVGVEEEFVVVDDEGRAVFVGGDVVDATADLAPDGAQIEREIKQEMVETGTSPRTAIADVRDELRRLRRIVLDETHERGHRLLAVGLVPTVDWRRSQVVEGERYQRLAELHGRVMEKQVVAGLHVHVEVPSRADGVAVLNRLGPWLPLLLVLSTSSPLYEGTDTGYASYRTMLWQTWMTSGLPAPFTDVEEHDRLVEQLVRSGAVHDAGQVYWPARLSEQYPTIEVRVSDACATIDEALLQAMLFRAIVVHLLAEAAGEVAPARPLRPELARAMVWQAARYGLDGELLHPRVDDWVPARSWVHDAVEVLRPVLEVMGDASLTTRLCERVLTTGTSADRQRAVLEDGGGLGDVLALLAAETAEGV